MSKQNNISLTAYKVLALLKLLCSGSFNIDNIIKQLYEDQNIKKQLSKEVLIKYITTLRSADINIQKPSKSNNYEYSVKDAPLLIDLDDNDIKILSLVLYISHKLAQKNIIQNLESLIEKLKIYLNNSQKELFNEYFLFLKKEKYRNEMFKKFIPEELIEQIQKLERYCNEDMRTSILYNLPASNKKIELIFEPKQIKYEKKSIYLSGYNFITGEKQFLDIKNIINITQLPIKSKYTNVLSPVIFKIKGKLAASYRLYESEKITKQNEDNNEIIITSYVEDKNLLLKRLLKYGENCEVIQPLSLREEIKQTIESALSQYE